MNIHGLDDQSLLVIFDKLAVEDLLRAGRTCSRWNFIRAKSALTRHSLTLLVGEHARNRIDNSNLDNIPYGYLLTDDYERPLHSAIKCKDLRNAIVRYKISSFEAKFLAHLFPNITNFTGSIKSDIKSVNSLTCLLKVWSTDSKLTTLKLYTYDLRDKHQISNKTERSYVSANRRLLSTINSITSLRVLTFDIDSMLFYVKGDLYAGDVKLDFSPILSQLERLHLYSHDDNCGGDALVNALTRFKKSNDNLKEIGINSEQCVSKYFNNWITKIPPKLARRFTQICLQIDNINKPLFPPFCARFSNLTSLQLNINRVDGNFNSTKFFPPIASLTQLISLTIEASVSTFALLRVDHANFDEHPVSSVKVLKFVVFKLHENDNPYIFGRIFLWHYFANVQVFIFEQLFHSTLVEAIVDKDTSLLKSVLFSCASDFRNIKMIQTINPDREWTRQEILPEEDVEEDEDDQTNDFDDYDPDDDDDDYRLRRWYEDF